MMITNYRQNSASTFTLNKQQGISLLSALIAVTIFSIGILAVLKLQGNLYLGVSESKERVTATELALAKIDDLKSYEILTTTSGSFAYDDIVNNAGGSIASGATTISGTSFNLAWVVTDYYYAGTELAATTTVPTPAPPHADYKHVIVTVSWVDRNNDALSVQLEETIAAINPASSGITVSGSGSLSTVEPSTRTSTTDGFQPTF